MHIYDCEDGSQVPSVTTILKLLGSDDIIRWANYLGYKHINYDEEMDRTADIGTTIHKCVQRVVDPNNTTEIVEFKNSFDADYFKRITEIFKRFISNFTYETIFTEKAFASSELGYGGTLDWYCKIAKKHMLIDFKSSKQVRLKHLLQLGGYYSLLKKYGYIVDGAAILIINSKECRMYPINENDLKILSTWFNQLAVLYKNLNGGKIMIPSDRTLLKELKTG